MILHRELERARRAPPMLFDVLRFITADRNGRIGKIGHSQRDVFYVVLNFRERVFVCLQFVADAGNFGHQHRYVFALTFRHADGFRARIAQVLQFLRFRLHGFTPHFEALDCILVERIAARFELIGDAIQLAAQQSGIKHDVS